MAIVHDVMPVFELFQPMTVDDTLALLEKYDQDAWVLAGGMDTFDWLKDRNKRRKVVVDLSGVQGLSGVKTTADGGIEIGATTTLTDLVKNQEQMQIVRLILASQAMARPFAAPPGIPEDRKRALIEAFDKTMKDPDFLAEAEKMKADVNPVSAGAIDSLLAEVYKTPKEIIAKAAKATANSQD